MTALPGDDFRAACAPFLARGYAINVDFEPEAPLVVLTVIGRDGSERRLIWGELISGLDMLRRSMRLANAKAAPSIKEAANDAH